MTYEVERKFWVDDLSSVETRLRALGARIAPAHLEVDCYYAHPSRDFATTDEALRLRRSGEQYFITYKGPRIDRQTKTRREIELPLATVEAARGDYGQLLEALGFRPVATVSKERRLAELAWESQTLHATLDRVERLGTFVELEQLASEATLDAARDSLARLAKALGLDRDERRSYLEMLLAGS